MQSMFEKISIAILAMCICGCGPAEGQEGKSNSPNKPKTENASQSANKQSDAPIEVVGTLIQQGLLRKTKPVAGSYYKNSPSAWARINVTQNIGDNRYLCSVVDHYDISVMESLLEVFIVETDQEFADGERLKGGVFQYVGMASYQSVMGAKKTVRVFKELEGPKLEEYNARETEKAKQDLIDRERAEKERQRQVELLNTEAITNVQNFIKSMKLDLDPRNRIHIDKCLRDKLKIVVPRETLFAMEAKKNGDIDRINGAKDLVKSYKENRQLTQEETMRFYNCSFRYLNREVRLEWLGFNQQGKKSALAIFRMLPSGKKDLVEIRFVNDNFTPFDKTDSFLRKQRHRCYDPGTNVDNLSADLTIRTDMSFDNTAALFVFCLDEDESYGFKCAEASFNAVAPRYEELVKQINREVISKDDFGKKSLELKRELYAALVKASENEGVEKFVAENAARKSKEAENQAIATEAAKKRFAERVDPRTRIFIDKAITNIVSVFVPKKTKEAVEALKKGNMGYFTTVANPAYESKGLLSKEEIKQIDVAIANSSGPVRFEFRNGHHGLILIKVYVGDTGRKVPNEHTHDYDDFLQYGLIHLGMGPDFAGAYNRMERSYGWMELHQDSSTGDAYLEETAYPDERIFVFEKGKGRFEFAIKAFKATIEEREKLSKQRNVSKMRDDDSFSEEEYKKKISELKVKFCDCLKKAIDM